LELSKREREGERERRKRRRKRGRFYVRTNADGVSNPDSGTFVDNYGLFLYFTYQALKNNIVDFIIILRLQLEGYWSYNKR
jgi:hypothetical protein